MLSLSDMSRLEKLGEWHISPFRFAVACGLLLLFSILMVWLLMALTPLHNLLPRYSHKSQTAANRETVMRLDSLQAAYEQNEAYLNNIASVLMTDRIPSDSAMASQRTTNPLTPDSLIPASPEEQKFVRGMQEKERFNVDVMAPLAAENMILLSPCDEGRFEESSRGSVLGVIYTPIGSNIRSIADGTVISSDFHNGVFSMIIQHPKGFISKYSGLASPLVNSGEKVIAGQAISLAPAPRAKKPPQILLQLWHNGDPLIPYEYLSTFSPAS